MSDRTVAVVPASPPHYELRDIERMAVSIAKSGMFAVTTMEGAFTLLLIAQAEGIHPAQAMMDYDVIKGKPALKSAAMLARFQRAGGKVQWITSTDEAVEGKFSHPLGGELVVKWDTARIAKAGLGGKEMHQKFPLQMKRARCISEAIRAIAPQCVPIGMYTVEETRDMPEEIDVTPVSENKAVAQAVAQVKNALSNERVEALIMTLDVKTRDELVAAYNPAIKEAREAGDEHAQQRIKSARDGMLEAIGEIK